MLQAGRQLGNYRILNLIKRGGMGEVYRAEDVRLPRQVAIKVVQSEPTLYPNSTTSQDNARLFQREMAAIATLDHPNILPLIDFGEETGSDGTQLTYMVMPLRPEGSLSDWLRRRGRPDPLTPEEVGSMLRDAGSALAYAHSHGIVHQDVKPSNFLIRTRDEQPDRPSLLLADFGVAKLTGTSRSSTNVRGTLEYMSPEQLNGHATPASDQYALAVMAYELLTGQVPFRGNPTQVIAQHAQAIPLPPSAINPRIPKQVDSVILRALSKNPAMRFPTTIAFASAYDFALQGRQDDGSPEDRTELKAPPPPEFSEFARTRQNTGQAAAVQGPPNMGFQQGPPNNAFHSSNTFQTRQAARPLSSRGLLIITVAALLVIAGGIGIVYSASHQNPSNGGGSVNFAATQQASNLTATAAQGNANATASAASQQSQQDANATATAVANANASATAQALQSQQDANATATAIANANATATAQANTPTVVLQDAMSGPSSANWDQNGNCFYTQGYYSAYSQTTNTQYSCFAEFRSFSDFAFRVNMRIQTNTSGFLAYSGGVVFRGNGNSYYCFRIFPNGNYTLEVYSNGSSVNTLSHGFSSAINQGSQTNTLEVAARGNTIGLAVNGQQIAQVSDSTYSQGLIGVFSDALNQISYVGYNDATFWTYGS